ncbi:10625_t:CDS:2 [Cetraspora pellucida]|uniref:10625_t:CDS:1 n=1 Tax=Cetraspora pellucida TaxID=1433469 RepID=A0A9N9B2N4_9GLOM|nr:10625_t:CDS:2 [Cetraspora pellucida]
MNRPANHPLYENLDKGGDPFPKPKTTGYQSLTQSQTSFVSGISFYS